MEKATVRQMKDVYRRADQRAEGRNKEEGDNTRAPDAEDSRK